MKPCIFSSAVIFCFVLFSCDSEKKISREVFEEVRNANEIKKLSEVDIITEAMKWGDEISAEAQHQLMEQLHKAIATHGIPGAVEFCNVEALPILKETGDSLGVIIRRTSNDYRNPADQPTEDEKALLEAYEYNEKNQVNNEPNVQKIKNGNVLLYTKAITIPGSLCLNCHGIPGSDINEETLEKLNRLYPEDKAQGHQLGDLRGMWSISIPQKEIVNRL
jgi:hypothetical protein